ncbi:MAG TPA: TOBE domain-containing protein [Thermoanaerobaculia bacterium]|nr:TOBE domain-containing protein [Thermoanaerobaculia bacterium]
MRVGQAVQVVVRPEKLALRDPGHGGLTGRGGSVPASGEVAVAVTVEERVYQGASTLWIVRAGAGPRYLVSEPSTQQESAAGRPAAAAEARRTALVPGSPALLCWDPRHTVVVRDA